jgi:hypothetical protein
MRLGFWRGATAALGAIALVVSSVAALAAPATQPGGPVVHGDREAVALDLELQRLLFAFSVRCPGTDWTPLADGRFQLSCSRSAEGTYYIVSPLAGFVDGPYQDTAR